MFEVPPHPVPCTLACPHVAVQPAPCWTAVQPLPAPGALLSPLPCRRTDGRSSESVHGRKPSLSPEGVGCPAPCFHTALLSVERDSQTATPGSLSGHFCVCPVHRGVHGTK